MSDHSRSKIVYERDMEDSEVEAIYFHSLYPCIRMLRMLIIHVLLDVVVTPCGLIGMY